VPDIDLRCGPAGLWADLEGMPPAEANNVVDSYLRSLAKAAQRRGVESVYLRPGAVLAKLVSDRLNSLGGIVLRMDAELSGDDHPTRALGSIGVIDSSALSGMEAARTAALDTIKFFGHEPGSHKSTMPAPNWRRLWWELLPEYGRFHREHGTAAETGEFTWLEVRPELVISPLLKSLVQPGFEMVPRVMGFAGLRPMHIKWRRGRYHFRSDTFAVVWRAIVSATWNAEYMADLLRRIRASYDDLAAVLVLFPRNDAQRARLSPLEVEALITSWWPRWVEFFALCWFIQAQGDDVLYPFIGETVKDNLGRLSESPDFCWPGSQDLVAPTTPVLSGEYMADVMKLRQALFDEGLTDAEAALAALDRGEAPAVAECVAKHLARWHWMRDRDLLFEPWDTPARVIRTALATDAHSAVPYDRNLRQQMVALGLHSDLAAASDRSEGLHHAVRFLHDLNVERENHHVLWLKFSYLLRSLVLEVERRLVAVGSLRPGEVFFLEMPELIAATRALPSPLPPELVRRVRNRRIGFLHEARLERSEPGEPDPEDDYY